MTIVNTCTLCVCVRLCLCLSVYFFFLDVFSISSWVQLFLSLCSCAYFYSSSLLWETIFSYFLIASVRPTHIQMRKTQNTQNECTIQIQMNVSSFFINKTLIHIFSLYNSFFKEISMKTTMQINDIFTSLCDKAK